MEINFWHNYTFDSIAKHHSHLNMAIQFCPCNANHAVRLHHHHCMKMPIADNASPTSNRMAFQSCRTIVDRLCRSLNKIPVKYSPNESSHSRLDRCDYAYGHSPEHGWLHALEYLGQHIQLDLMITLVDRRLFLAMTNNHCHQRYQCSLLPLFDV